jgi:nicotinamide-nucleotide amidase
MLGGGDVVISPERLVGRLRSAGLQVAVAESLTGGLLASRFARLDGASGWFRGGLVAYAADVKHDLLGVGPVPVVSEQAARQMAAGVKGLLGADAAVAVTGVGGPGHSHAELHRFEGSPALVCEATCDAALAQLDAALAGLPSRR